MRSEWLHEWQPLAPRGQSDWCCIWCAQPRPKTECGKFCSPGFVVEPPTACSNQSTTHSRLSQVGSLMTRSPDMRDRKKLFLHRCSQPKYFVHNFKVCTNMAFLSPAELLRPSFSRKLNKGHYRHSWHWGHVMLKACPGSEHFDPGGEGIFPKDISHSDQALADWLPCFPSQRRNKVRAVKGLVQTLLFTTSQNQ